MKKINKKGFTLTELLATIAILALVAVIATPAVIGVSNSIKKNMLDSKIKLLLQAGKLYGEDKDVTGVTSVSVEQLITDKYITCDDKASATDCILNPKNNSSMKTCQITISSHSTSGRISTSWATSNTSDACKWE